ncbi:MAG: response regulator transcription factor [Bacteroidales bacterium]
MKKILYVEDEPFLGKIVFETLQKQGFSVVLVQDGAKVQTELESFSPDICILDIMLPHVDGYTLCRKLRQQYPAMPVIFLTARTETPDLVRGFEAGGTDYMRKPFSIEELIVRINNQLNLVSLNLAAAKIPGERMLGKYRFVPGRYELHTPSQLIRLSQREQEILELLTARPNQVVDRKHLLTSVWKDDSFFNSRTLDVYVRKLRTYFGEDSQIEIVTLKGKGYLFLMKQ